jgi:hypothetical protein
MVKLELTKEELETLAGLVDVAVKSMGLRSVLVAAPIVEKLEAAAAEIAED